MSAHPKGRPGRPQKRPSNGTYPNLLTTDALAGGRITLFRNPASPPTGRP